MSDNKRKEYIPLVIVIQIFDVKTDKMENETIKAIDSRERRDWISKTVLWATMNNKYVTIINKNDDN